jgi:hypothetical protein
MPITPLPTPAPSTSDPSTFDARADALIAALPVFVTEANALEVNVMAEELVATTQAAAATAQAVLADSAADIALAAANFKGLWSAQSGAATVPYAVSHLGKFWQLASNLANVASKTPGTDVEWIEINSDYGCTNLSEVIQYPDPALSINYELLSTGLTADRNYTFPDVDTMLAGAAVLAENITEIINYTTVSLETQLTSITHTPPGTPDYAIQDLINSSAYGFATKDEGNTVLKVILNLQTRMVALETELKTIKLLA